MKLFKKKEVNEPLTEDEMIENLIQELNNESKTKEELELEMKAAKVRKIRRYAIYIGLVLLVSVGIYYLISETTYTKANVERRTEMPESSELGTYDSFADGIIRYSKEGVSYLSKRGKEKWNIAFAMGNPIFYESTKSGIVYDKGGKSLVIFDSSGEVGRIDTGYLIVQAKVTDSKKVMAILRSGEELKIVCYELTGDEIATVSPNALDVGYPLDALLFEDGKNLAVSYLRITDGKPSSKISYYNFSDAGKNVPNHEVFTKEISGEVIPKMYFANNSTIFFISDRSLYIYKGSTKPSEVANVKMDGEIKSIGSSEGRLAVLVKNDEKIGFRLCLYNNTGKLTAKKGMSNSFEHMTMASGDVIFYEGKRCEIYSDRGVLKFKGSLPNETKRIWGITGVNKYISITNEGIEEIRFTK